MFSCRILKTVGADVFSAEFQSWFWRNFPHYIDTMAMVYPYSNRNPKTQVIVLSSSLVGHRPSRWINHGDRCLRSWPSFILTQKAEGSECCFLVSFLFLIFFFSILFWTPAHGMVLPTFRVGLSISNNLSQKTPHRHTYRFASMLIFQFCQTDNQE